MFNISNPISQDVDTSNLMMSRLFVFIVTGILYSIVAQKIKQKGKQVVRHSVTV